MPAPDSVKFNNGDIVKRVTEDDERGIVVGIIYRPNGIEYLCRWPSCTDETKHYDVELEMVEEFVGGEKE